MATKGEMKQRILAYLRARAGRGEYPSLREIAEEVGVTVPTVRQHLQELEAAGHLTRSRSARGIRLTKGIGVPVVGRIAAGQPLLAVESMEEEVVANPALFSGGEIVALRVEGRSMTDAGIRDGDLAIIRRQPTVESGEVAAVLLDDECTLKRVIFEGRNVVLRPECEGFDPIVPRPGQNVRICGKLVGIVRQMRGRTGPWLPVRQTGNLAEETLLPERAPDEQIRALRAMTMEQRLQTAQNLCVTAREWKACALRSFHPDWSEEKIREEVRDAFLYGG